MMHTRLLIALTFTCLSVLMVSTLPMNAQARQFRQVVPIATPKKNVASLPEGAQAVEKAVELGRDVVTAAVNDVISKWNTADMQSTLGEQFFDRARLGDAMDTLVPRDAILSVQSVQGIQTLQQYLMPADEGEDLVSIVSATVRTQLEFNNPSTGFVRLPGVNEFVLQVTQPAPR